MADDDTYGPALPPGFASGTDEPEETSETQSEKTSVIGPQCPSSFLKHDQNQGSRQPGTSEQSHSAIGPSLPPGFVGSDRDSDSGEEGEEWFGPMPAGQPCDENVNDVVHRIESRSKNMKMRLDGTDVEIKKPQREEWMTTPNTTSRNQLGAISRCLSDHKAKPSSEVSRSKSPKREYRSSGDSDSEESRKAKKKKQKSLLELHQKSKKKKKKKDKEKQKESSKLHERKPFDRDTELSVRMMSKDQVNSVIQKSKFLNSRFSAGASKYL